MCIIGSVLFSVAVYSSKMNPGIRALPVSSARNKVSGLRFEGQCVRFRLTRNVQQFQGGLVFMAHRPLLHPPRGLRAMKQKRSFERCGSGTPDLSVERLPKTFPTFYVTPYFTPPSPPHPKSSSTHLTELPSPPRSRKRGDRGGSVATILARWIPKSAHCHPVA